MATAQTTTPLLPSNHPTTIHPRRLLLLLTAAFTAAAAIAAVFVFLLATGPRRDIRPTVLLISLDGFRFNYHLKSPTPNIRRLISTGTSAADGLIPVFPTLTFPNHYSIATGLHPSAHGIVNNRFRDPKTTGRRYFTAGSHDPDWWLGEPLWHTAANQGFPAAAYFWAGSEVPKGNWTCPPQFCPRYNRSVPFERRVDEVLGYFDLPPAEIPIFIGLYFEDPDSQGHRVGPDDPHISAAVARMDSVIGRLIAGLEQRGVFEDVSMILVGDHGMVGTCDRKLIFIEDFAPWIEIPDSWIDSLSPLLAIWPDDGGISPAEVVEKMREGLRSGEVENGEYLRVFLREDLPERLHYSESDRIPPIVGLVDEAYMVEYRRTKQYDQCGGAHGYDNEFFSMRTIFVAHGPRFKRGLKVPSFQNVEIYNLITSILKLRAAPNNGSASFLNSILLPSP